MDILTLAMAKAYTDSKGGYDNSYSMTFDGNTEGKVMIPLMNGVSFVKVSNKVLSKEELLGATYVSFDGKTIVIAEKNIFDNSAVGATTQFFGVMADNMTDAPVIVSSKACTINFGGVPVTVPNDGTYFIYIMMGSAMYVSSLSNETIVPIDQKYLPGVCLPVVEIADISAITAEEGAELGKHIGMPVVIKVTIDGTLNCCVFNYTYVDAYRTHLYGTTIGTDAVILTSSDGVSWAKG